MSSRENDLVIVRFVVEQQHTPTQAAARFAVTRQWVHTLPRRYAADGPTGVTPGSRAPKIHPGALPNYLRERITSHADTGEMLAHNHINPDKNYQPRATTPDATSQDTPPYPQKRSWAATPCQRCRDSGHWRRAWDSNPR